MKNYLFYLILSISLLPNLSYASDVKAQVDRNSASIDESIQLTVTFKDEEGNVDISPIIDFKVISQSASTNVQIINSQMTKEFSYNYTLIPQRKGKLTIPPLPVTVNNKKDMTEEIVIQISDSSQTRSLSVGNEKDVFVQADVSNVSLYEGQQIIYTFKFYRSVNIANIKFQKPDFKDFTSKALEEKKPYQTFVSGKEYIITELKYLLTPLKKGELSIEPAILTCDVISRIKRRSSFPFDSFFDDSFFAQKELQPRILRTEPININVMDLPKYNGNEKFSGLIGKFNIEAKLTEKRIKVGNSTTLEVIISGHGNIMDAATPQIDVSNIFKIYPDKAQEDIAHLEEGSKGRKIFRFALVATQHGDYEIKPIKLVFFDSEKGRYEVISTQHIPLKVDPSDEKDKLDVFKGSQQEETPKIAKKKVEFVGRDILPLKEELEALTDKKQLSLLQFILFLLIPAFLYFIFKFSFWLIKKEKNIVFIMIKRSEDALNKASEPSISEGEFLSNLYKALIFIIYSINETKGESLTCKEAESILKSKGFSDKLIKEALTLFQDVESAQFSGMSLDSYGKLSLLAKTKNLISSLKI